MIYLTKKIIFLLTSMLCILTVSLMLVGCSKGSTQQVQVKSDTAQANEAVKTLTKSQDFEQFMRENRYKYGFFHGRLMENGSGDSENKYKVSVDYDGQEFNAYLFGFGNKAAGGGYLGYALMSLDTGSVILTDSPSEASQLTHNLKLRSSDHLYNFEYSEDKVTYTGLEEHRTPSSSNSDESSNSRGTTGTSENSMKSSSDSSRSDHQETGDSSTTKEIVRNNIHAGNDGSTLQHKGADVLQDFIDSKQFVQDLTQIDIAKGVKVEAMYDPDTGDTNFVGYHTIVRVEFQGSQGGQFQFYTLNNNNGRVNAVEDSRTLPSSETTGAMTTLTQTQIENLTKQ